MREDKRILIVRALEERGALCAKEIQKTLGINYNVSSLLGDLENRGQIRWVLDPSKPKHTAGQAKRLYSLTEKGKQLVRCSYGNVRLD